MRPERDDSEIGHFIQADTIVPGAGDPLAWNRYAYVTYNPLKYNDPSGHWVNIAIGAVVGAIVGGVTYAITNQGDSFNGWECAAAAGVGALAGAAISVGLVGAAGAAVATTSGLVGGGAAALVGSEFYMIENQNEFETDEFLLNAGINAATGAITANPATPIDLIDTAEVLGSVGSMVATTDNPSTIDYALAGISGLVAAGVDVGVGKVFDNNFIPNSKTQLLNQFPNKNIWPEGFTVSNNMR